MTNYFALFAILIFMVTFSKAQTLNKTNPKFLYQAGRNEKICKRQISQNNCADNGTCCNFGSCCLNDTRRVNKQYCHICDDESLCCPLGFCCYKPQKVESQSSNSGQKFLQLGIVVVAMVGFILYVILAIKFGSKRTASENGDGNGEDDVSSIDAAANRSNDSSLFAFLVRRGQQQRQPATYVADNVVFDEPSAEDSTAGLPPPPPYTP